jgi:hypothetical protein
MRRGHSRAGRAIAWGVTRTFALEAVKDVYFGGIVSGSVLPPAVCHVCVAARVPAYRMWMGGIPGVR